MELLSKSVQGSARIARLQIIPLVVVCIKKARVVDRYTFILPKKSVGVYLLWSSCLILFLGPQVASVWQVIACWVSIRNSNISHVSCRLNIATLR